MPDQRIATTRLDTLKPLGSPGQRSYEFIVGILQRSLGEDYSKLLAEPSTSSSDRGVDWYTPVSGRVRPFNELSEEERTAAKEHIGRLVADILALADRHEASGDEASQRIAIALRNAVEVPGDDTIYLVGDQPVVIHWAHRLDKHHAPQGVLRKMVPRRRSVADAQPVAAAVGPAAAAVADVVLIENESWRLSTLLWWFGWGLLAIMTASILYLTLTACGIGGFSFLNRCPAVYDSGPLAAVAAERRAVEREIGDLQQQIATAQGQCRPVQVAEPKPVPDPEPVPEPEPEPEPEPQPQLDEFEERVGRAGGEQGELTITLIWGDTSDLDLHVTCPRGDQIDFNNMAACNGALDVDSNRRNGLGFPDNAARITTEPVENVRWTSGPPPGTYRVVVNLFAEDITRRSRQHPFKLKFKAGGREEFREGVVAPGRRSMEFQFTY